MRLRGFRHFACALALTLGAAGSSSALTVEELQRLLQTSPTRTVAFEETRQSPWLAAPVTSQGTMHSESGVLEKRVRLPREETWRMLSDRVEWAAPNDSASRRILFSQSPGLAVLADTLRRVVAGDLQSLQNDFRVDVRGDRGGWTVRLHPVSASVERFLQQVELEGAGSALRVITVVEQKGERTITRLGP